MSTHARLRYLFGAIGGAFVGAHVPSIFGEHWLIGLSTLVVYLILQAIALYFIFPEASVKS